MEIFTPYSDASDGIDKLLNSFNSRYQEQLETSMKRSAFIFDSVQIMYYNCHKVGLYAVIHILILQSG